MLLCWKTYFNTPVDPRDILPQGLASEVLGPGEAMGYVTFGLNANRRLNVGPFTGIAFLHKALFLGVNSLSYVVILRFNLSLGTVYISCRAHNWLILLHD